MSTSLSSYRSKIGYTQDQTFSEKFPLEGGLNLDNPAVAAQPGEAIQLTNYEPSFAGGYRSKQGFERIDGRMQPSAYGYLQITIMPTVTVHAPGGTEVWGLTSQAIGFVSTILGTLTPGVPVTMIVSKAFKSRITTQFPRAAGDTMVVGSELFDFQVGETIALYSAPGTSFGTITDIEGRVTSDAYDSGYMMSSNGFARYRIKPVGDTLCAGPSLGACDFGGSVIAFRNNAANTQALAFYATQWGWKQLLLGSMLYFKGGTNAVRLDPGGQAIQEGDVITGQTSGATCTATRVYQLFGSFQSGDCLGYIIAASITGTFTAGENLKVSGNTVGVTPATGTIAQAITLPPNGSYRFRLWNFDGFENHYRLYGINSVGLAFEIDASNMLSAGTIVFTPITTGLGLTLATFNSIPTTDAPTHIMVHNDHLFLGYQGGSLQNSGYQTPRDWQSVVGADERMLGEDIMDMVEQGGNTSFISSRRGCFTLSGAVRENFQLTRIADFGVLPYTSVQINGLTYMTDEGVMFQYTSAQFGDYASSSISEKVGSLLNTLRDTGAGVVEASLSRDRSLYRLYFDNGKCLVFCVTAQEYSVSQGAKGIGFVDYGQTVHNIWSSVSTIYGGNNPPGLRERVFMCADDGYVYEDDSGTVFDYNLIRTHFAAVYYQGQQNLNNVKQYRAVYVDMLASSAMLPIVISAGYEDGMGFRTDEAGEVAMAFTGGVRCDVTLMDTSRIDAGEYARAYKTLHGRGTAISIRVNTQSGVSPPHTLQAIEIVNTLRSRRIGR